MRPAATEYLQEEARLRGSRPRVKVVLYPFDLDYGLAPGSGEFVHTVYGGEPGKLAMAEGYHPFGSWTSPVMHTFSPHLRGVAASWEDRCGGLTPRVYLRAGETPGAAAQAPYAFLAPQEEAPLAPYFQVKVEFQPSGRAWAVDSPEEADAFTAYGVEAAPDPVYESYAGDGEAPGYLADLRLEGRLTLPEEDILDPGTVRVDLARDFSALRAGDHRLLLDNRQGQWLESTADFYLQGLGWRHLQVGLYHGWELPGGQVQWQLVYLGVFQRLTGMAHGWQEPHRARLESQDRVAAGLSRRLGTPSPQGERRPFLRGFYLARGELRQSFPASVSEPVKSGSGTATLRLLGDYRGEYPQDYLLEIEASGEVGSATFRWSNDAGQSWQERDLLTPGPGDPVALDYGLAAYWDSAPGLDLVAGDRWTFSTQPARYQYQVPGAPFEAITAVYLNGVETREGVTWEADAGLVTVSSRSAQVEARVVKDATTHPVDIITHILAEVGLGQAIHQESFALARSLTPEYAVGVCFENVTAAQAMRELLRRCLYDLWVDLGEIKIRAYLGQD
jgi:hypothetical protein